MNADDFNFEELGGWFSRRFDVHRVRLTEGALHVLLRGYDDSFAELIVEHVIAFRSLREEDTPEQSGVIGSGPSGFATLKHSSWATAVKPGASHWIVGGANQSLEILANARPRLEPR